MADTTLCLILNLYRRTYWLANMVGIPSLVTTKTNLALFTDPFSPFHCPADAPCYRRCNVRIGIGARVVAGALLAVLGPPVPIRCFDCCPASSVAILDTFGGFVLMMAAGVV